MSNFVNFIKASLKEEKTPEEISDTLIDTGFKILLLAAQSVKNDDKSKQ